MNLRSSAVLQARSIYALLLRRMRTQYGESRAGYAWAVVEPIIWVFVLKMAIRGGGTGGTPPLGTSLEVFFTSGIVLARMWRTSTMQVATVLARNKKERLPILHRLDSTYAVWLLECMTSGVALVIILALLAVAGFDAMPNNLLMCFVGFMLCALWSLAFGVLFALILTVAPALNHFKGIIVLIGFMTSGFSFVVDRMPPGLRNVVIWNPLLHVIEFFREGFYRGYESRAMDLTYLLAVCFVCLLFGLAGERALRRHNTKDQFAEGSEDAFM